MIAPLVLATCWAVSTVSIWLIPPYLLVMGWLLWDPVGRRVNTTNPADARESSREAPDLDSDERSQRESESDAEPEAIEVDVPEEPASAAETAPVKSRRRARRKSKPAAEPTEATWIQVAPGKFVRAESPAGPAEGGPHLPEDALAVPSESATNPVASSESESAATSEEFPSEIASAISDDHAQERLEEESRLDDRSPEDSVSDDGPAEIASAHASEISEHPTIPFEQATASGSDPEDSDSESVEASESFGEEPGDSELHESAESEEARSLLEANPPNSEIEEGEREGEEVLDDEAVDVEDAQDQEEDDEVDEDESESDSDEEPVTNVAPDTVDDVATVEDEPDESESIEDASNDDVSDDETAEEVETEDESSYEYEDPSRAPSEGARHRRNVRSARSSLLPRGLRRRSRRGLGRRRRERASMPRAPPSGDARTVRDRFATENGRVVPFQKERRGRFRVRGKRRRAKLEPAARRLPTTWLP